MPLCDSKQDQLLPVVKWFLSEAIDIVWSCFSCPTLGIARMQPKASAWEPSLAQAIALKKRCQLVKVWLKTATSFLSPASSGLNWQMQENYFCPFQNPENFETSRRRISIDLQLSSFCWNCHKGNWKNPLHWTLPSSSSNRAEAIARFHAGELRLNLWTSKRIFNIDLPTTLWCLDFWNGRKVWI